MGDMRCWRPTHCTLQLSFLRWGACGDKHSQHLREGEPYSGTSTIRYVRCHSTANGNGSASPAGTPPASSELHAESPRREDGLHFHAITTVPRSLPNVKPLTLLSVRVQLPSQRNGADSLRVLRVVEEDSVRKGCNNSNCDRSNGVPSVNKGEKGKGAWKQEKLSSKKWRCNSARFNNVDNDEGCTQQDEDPGSKRIYFDGGSEMPVGSIVFLTVTFTGRVQARAQGGIYACGQKDGAGQRILLTHFEVTLARLAFPCPDHPQEYRIVWHLQSLQFPGDYKLVVSNTPEVARKEVRNKGVQYSFAPIGPLPAYVIAFAAFAGSVELLEEELQLRDFPTPDDIGHTAGSSKFLVSVDGKDNHPMRTVTMRLVTHAESGVTAAVLAQVAHTVREAIRLLEDFFDSPLPLQYLPFSSACSSDGQWNGDYYNHFQQRCKGGEMLTIVVAPAVPYISGMEHHGCILLDESLYKSAQSCGGTASKATAKSNSASSGVSVEVERVELIVHELVHHWVGNALGMPFVLKEGVCQLMEQCLGDVIMGKPVRKVRHAATTGNATVSHNGRGSSVPQAADDAGVTIVDAERGKEFTNRCYREALNTLTNLVNTVGFHVFKERMQRMYALEVLSGEQSGKGLRLPPYVSASQFMVYMNSHSSAANCK